MKNLNEYINESLLDKLKTLFVKVKDEDIIKEKFDKALKELNMYEDYYIKFVNGKYIKDNRDYICNTTVGSSWIKKEYEDYYDDKTLEKIKTVILYKKNSGKYFMPLLIDPKDFDMFDTTFQYKSKNKVKLPAIWSLKMSIDLLKRTLTLTRKYIDKIHFENMSK